MSILVVKTGLSSQISFDSPESLWFLIATITHIDYNDFVSGWNFPRNVSKYSQVPLAHNELFTKAIINGEPMCSMIRETSANTRTISPLCVCVPPVLPGLAHGQGLLGARTQQSRDLQPLLTEGSTTPTFLPESKAEQRPVASLLTSFQVHLLQ